MEPFIEGQRCLFCRGEHAPGQPCDGKQGAVDDEAERASTYLYPPANWTDTSQAAAESMKDETSTIRGKIYAYMVSLGWIGTTSDEVEVRLNLRHQTAAARLTELWHTLHVIEDSGRRRPTRSGRKAIVFVVVGLKHA